MTRIKMVPVESMDPELREMTGADHIPYSTGEILAHQPEMAKALIRFQASLKKHRTIPDKLVELVRLRIAFHSQCRLCMAVRYRDALEDGLTEGLVCSLEKPAEAADLTGPERAAIDYADLFASDHLRIDDATFDRLREHFTEAQIVELGLFCAMAVGTGRLTASWDVTEGLPDVVLQGLAGKSAPWAIKGITVG